MDYVLKTLERILPELILLVEPVCELLQRERLQMLLLVHDDDEDDTTRDERSAPVSASLFASGKLDARKALSVLTACVRRIIYQSEFTRSYATSARKPVTRLGVIERDQVEMCLVFGLRHDGSQGCIGELLLRRGEAEQVAAALRLAPEGRTQADWQAIASPGLDRLHFEAAARKLERDMHDMCLDKPLGVIAAAVHGLVCRNQVLRDLLLQIDATCEHYEQQSAVQAVIAVTFDE